VVTDKMPAGYGPVSDGVPEPRGQGGDSEREMPPPPRTSRKMSQLEATVKMRKQ
jgi:hypothetical protein